MAPAVLSCGEGLGKDLPIALYFERFLMTGTDLHLTLLCGFGAFALLLTLGRRLRLHLSRAGISISWERRSLR